MIAQAASFFPNTRLNRAGQVRCGLFFEKIVLYRLPLSQTGDDVQSSPAVSFMEVDFIKDDAEVKRILADFNRWAETYRDPGYLALLRGAQQEEDIEQSETKLISAIRGRSTSRAAKRDPRREAQIFLHFARELDRQYVEINDIFSQVEQDEKLLGQLMGAEPLEPDPEVPDRGPDLARTNGPGAEIMPRRLAAWAQFYAAFGPFDRPLLTDQPEAVSVMDLNLSVAMTGSRELPPAGSMEVIQPFMELRLPDPVDNKGNPIGDAGAKVLDGELGREWSQLVDQVMSGPISADQLVDLREKSRTLAAKTKAVGSDRRAATLTGYLLPGRDLKTAFLSAAGMNEDKPEKDVYCGPVFVITAMPA